ncbi:hypothetical protein [Acidovorax sp. A1169]|uniref:hypothetical protein n=1 Tax=Acidovorax sp. A1169 TaxID=3059524 RepID=UPI002737C15A|nr:hypothetical protein [Acidovorax sp. A1169]MDP4074827.1 hypothetical protein [Acidovorax sp. A1169]
MSARRPLAPATRLGITALVLLLLAACVLSIYAYDQLRDMRAASDRTRSQLMAQSLSLRISHAVESGIPLRGLVGIEALFQQRMASQPDIHAVALVLPDGKVLWEVTRDAAAAGVTAEAPVQVRGAPVATLRLALRDSGAATFARATAALLLPAIGLLALLAYLAARFSQAQGIELRNHAAWRARRAIAQGRYDNTVVLPQRRGFDLRVQQLGHAVRGVHEGLVRVRRLIASLRQTEPQHARRERLDQLLAKAEAHDRFAEHGIAQVRVVAAEAQVFWITLLVALSALALQTLWLRSLHLQGETPWQWQGLAPATAASLAAFFVAGTAAWSVTRWRRWPAPTVVLPACIALLATAMACASGLPASLPWTFAMAAGAWHGLVVGAVLAACQAVEHVPRTRPEYAHARPRWRAATWSAWTVTAVWLGPALGSLALDALGMLQGAYALLLPAVCAGFFVVRWNGPRSPWRSRTGVHGNALPATARPTADRTRALGQSGAAGLLLGLALAAHALGQPPIWAPLLGLGVAAGLFLRGRMPSPSILTAVAAVATLLALAIASGWLPTGWYLQDAVLVLAALLTGVALGRLARMAESQGRLPELSATQWAAMGVGAVVSSGALGAHLHGGWPLLAAALLLLVCSRHAARAAAGADRAGGHHAP